VPVIVSKFAQNSASYNLAAPSSSPWHSPIAVAPRAVTPSKPLSSSLVHIEGDVLTTAISNGHSSPEKAIVIMQWQSFAGNFHPLPYLPTRKTPNGYMASSVVKWYLRQGQCYVQKRYVVIN
jgi:hypothetical protein